MSAMANTTPIVTTVTKPATNPRDADATPRVNIQDLCEEYYEDILPIIMDKVRRDKRKEVHARLDFGEGSRERRTREDSHYSSARALTARPERLKVRDRLRYSDRHVLDRLGHRRQSEFDRLSETYWPSTTKSRPGITNFKDHPRGRSRPHRLDASNEGCPEDRERFCGVEESYDDSHYHSYHDRDRTRNMKMRRDSESLLSSVSKSDSSDGRNPQRKPKDGETIEDFMERFKVETGRMKGAPECMWISGFIHGVNNLELTKRLNEHVPKTMEEMMITTTAFIRGEAAGASKKKGHTSWRTHDQSKRQTSKKREITFQPLTTSSGAEGLLVIEAEIGGHMIDRMYVDRGSSMEILFDHCFNRLRPEVKNQVVPATTSLTGFNGETIWPLGQLRLLVTIGDAEHYTRAWMNFMIVRSLSPYDGIIGRPRIKEIQAVPSTAHEMLKFPVDGGIVTIRSTILIPAKCTTMITSSEVPKETGVRYENFKVALHPNFLDQEVAIEGTLSAKARTELCSLLKENLDIFAWQPSDMTRVSRSVAEHRLNIREGYSPVRQKKGQASKRAKAIQAEVQMLLEAGIIREDCYPVPEIEWKVKSLYGYPFKCFLDAYKGYHQIQLTESDEEKTAFHTGQGVYCYTKIPFGLKNAGATYQRLSHTEAEMLRDIDETFRTLRKINMKLNPKWAMEGMFLGYMVTSERIKPCPDKTEVVLQLPSPRTIKEVQSLYGKLASLNRFLSKTITKIERHTGRTQYYILAKDVGERTASNNEAENEALIAGLRIASQMGVRNVHVSVYFKLVANQVLGAYVAKEENMIKYLEKFKSLEGGEKAPYQGPTVRIIGGGSLQAVILYAMVKVRRTTPSKVCDQRNSCGVVQHARETTISGGQSHTAGILLADDASGRADMIRHGDTPFSLTHGTEAVIPAEIGMSTYRTAAVDVLQNYEELRLNLDLLEERRERAMIRKAKAKLKMPKYYNARVRDITFRPGDFVYRSNDASHAMDGGKLGLKWEGPYEVTEALRDGAYKLRSMDEIVLLRMWNIANLKRCYL
nr:reverse transcriptase domain-containing protein [Tanacetum cinerariifolium]GEY24895.1 reverse transcriptase domain-containing protein [Tanacetum cinerariifolium]